MKTCIPQKLLLGLLVASLAATPLARAGEDEGSTATVTLLGTRSMRGSGE